MVALALALSYVVAVAVGLFMVYQDQTLTRAQILAALGLNLIAAAVFGLIFAVISSRSQQVALEENFEESLNTMKDALLRGIAEHNRLYLPQAQYIAADDFDQTFNRDLMHSIGSSAFYGFRGPSPRYLPARIRISARHPQEIRVCMLDPRLRNVVARRAADRRMRPSERGKTVEQIIGELREELIMSVVALFDIRQICPVDVVYTEELGTSRVELFDEVAYLTLYHSALSAGRAFPESIRFAAGSLMYDLCKLDINRRNEISQRRIRFHSDLEDADLLAHLGELTGAPTSQEELERYRDLYATFSQSFVSHLQQVSGAHPGSLANMPRQRQ